MIKFLQVGKIINTHGIKGEVKVFALTDDPKRFDYLKEVYNVFNISIDENIVKKSNVLKIEGVKYTKGRVIIKFSGIDTIEAAEALKNSFLVINRDDAIKLSEDSFFVCELLGCEVTDEKRGFLGVITDIIETGSNDVYVVTKENKNILVPALKTVIKSVEIKDKKIIVELPEGI